MQDCTCDHEQNEKCPVCVRVQSPQVYRLDFTDEGEDQTAEQEVAGGQGHNHGDRSDDSHDNMDQVNNAETDQNVTDSLKETENSTDANCDANNECDKEKLVENNTEKNSNSNSEKETSVVKGELNNVNTKPKEEPSGKTKKGTKSKDIWPESSENRVVSQGPNQRDISNTDPTSNQNSGRKPQAVTSQRKPEISSGGSSGSSKKGPQSPVR